MEEQHQPWTNKELKLPNPTENVEQAVPPRDTYIEQKPVADQQLSENEFAEKAVEDVLKQSPEVAYNHTVAAAENDDPIERDRELRHEVRDKQSDTTQGAVPVGQVIADAANRQPVMQPIAPPPVEPPLPTSIAQAPNEPLSVPQPKLSLYRRAMLAGFITALFLILGYIFYRLVG